ncbi:MAG: type II secretion system protein [Lachnospiraceae bacterium]|nr:type II secretion system protein [Lachnospiraceae bacterium]
MKKMNNKGFSLIELIIVIAIMAVLVAVIAPNLTQYIGSSKKKTDASNADTIKSVINTALSDYSTAGSHDAADAADTTVDNDVVTSMATDIESYTTVDEIVVAGKADDSKLSWEYKVFEGLEANMTGADTSTPSVPCKQENKHFAVEIEAMNNSYKVTVKVKANN